MRRWLVTLAACALTVACGTAAVHPVTAPPPGADLRRIAVTAGSLDDLARADAAFGDDLLRRLLANNDSPDVVLSPASVSTALQMAYAGARGTAAAEMARVLHLTGDPRDVAAAAARLLAKLAPLAHSRDALLAVADAVWVQSGFALTPTYAGMMNTGFTAGLHQVDFAHATERARQTINRAVASATHGKIPELLLRGLVDSTTRLVLTNAVYLHARWLDEFDTAQSQPRPFRRADGSSVRAPTMSKRSLMAYAEAATWQAIRLPYVGGRLAMTIVVPHPGATPPRLSDVSRAHFHTRLVDLWLPKFRFRWTRDLVPTLDAMGMHAPFANGDFSAMSTSETLHISFVQHAAYISVDEHGTEAAAATGAGMAVSGMYVPAQPAVIVHADLPFLFAINDGATGLPLFAGRVGDPSVA